MIEPPKGLKAEGLRLWRATIADKAEGWRLEADDLAALEEACRLRDVAARLQRVVDREGMTVVGSQGQPVLHPAARELRLTRALIASTIKRVELAPPAARRKVDIDKSRKDQLGDARRKRWS
jgi:P27 family predicted phage terminase small subunit